MIELLHIGFSWGNLKERDYLEDISVNTAVILKWALKNRIGGDKVD
jgi:hypothetical protein